MRFYWFWVMVMAALPLAAMQTQRTKWNIWHLVHPNTRLLIGLDWRQALQSPLGPMLRKQVSEGGHPLLSFLESIENVDRLLVSSPGVAEEGKKAPLLVVAQGRFELSKIRRMATADGAVSRRYNDVELLVPSGAANEDIHFALLDTTTIVFGDGTSVKAAINRNLRQEPVNVRNLVVARSMTMSGTTDAWIVSEEPLEPLNSLGIGTMPFIEMLSGLEVGVAIREGVGIQLAMFPKTAEAGQQLKNGISPLLELLALQPQMDPRVQEIAKRCRISLERGAVRVVADLDRKLVETALNAMRTTKTERATVPGPADRLRAPGAAGAAVSLEGGVKPGAGPIVGAPALGVPVAGAPVLGAPVTTSSRKVVRIVGMEEGVKEIPYNPPTGPPED